uniref:Golgi SNAP receptor complex member 1 n=1 Tax=Cacopsylla melanoneura TaxID=428564 RepID=A0A8D8PT14_9HEMI
MNSWEELRKQARKLENDIDVKLTCLSKLGTGSHGLKSSESDTEPLLSADHMIESTASEIESLLVKLSDTNEKMSDIMAEGGKDAAAIHTLQRHKEILEDYKKELNKTINNIQSRKDREQLMHSVRKDIDSYKNSTSKLNRRMDMYLKENEHIRASDRLVQDQIQIVLDTREHLTSQRQHLKRLHTRLHDISSKFPLHVSRTLQLFR